MKNNKKKLQEQLKITNTEYEKLLKEDVKANDIANKQYKKRQAIIRNVSNKCYAIEEEIKNLDQEVLENKHSKKDIESAKLLLEECGYRAIKI